MQMGRNLALSFGHGVARAGKSLYDGWHDETSQLNPPVESSSMSSIPRLAWTKADKNALFMLILVLIVTASPLIANQLSASADYSWRIAQAYELAQGNWGEVFNANPLYSIAIFAIYSLVPMGWVFATVLIALCFYIFSAVSIYQLLMQVTKARSSAWAYTLALVVGGLLIIQPISLSPLLSTRDMLYEWVLFSPHHNPTTMALRPFALILTLWSADAFNAQVKSWKQVALVASLVVLSALIKPSWHIAFLPVFALAVVFAWLQAKALNWRLILWGFGFSSLLVLLSMYLSVFGSQDDSGIAFMPFFFDNPATLPYKLLLSLAFPLFVTWAYWQEAQRDTALMLAWAVFGVALLQGLLLNETGPRMGHGNFLWGKGAAGWVLFVLATRLYLQQSYAQWRKERPLQRRTRIALILFVLHTLTGLLWWLAHYGAKPVMYP